MRHLFGEPYSTAGPLLVGAGAAGLLLVGAGATGLLLVGAGATGLQLVLYVQMLLVPCVQMVGCCWYHVCKCWAAAGTLCATACLLLVGAGAAGLLQVRSIL